VLEARPALARYEGRKVVLGIRPEDLEDAAVTIEASPNQKMSVVTDLREDMGSEVYLHFSVHGRPVTSKEVEEVATTEVVEAIEERARRDGIPFVARVDRRTPAREGEPIELVVDTPRLHFFDPETGLGIYDGDAV
jgi:multiple sugar transport system ATP-binding protein